MDEPQASADPTPEAAPAKWYATPRAIAGAVAFLLLLHFVLANAGTWNKCGTFDEDSHIGNAYSFVATGDYRMFPVAIFQYRWMTLPLWLTGTKAPTTDHPMWGLSNNWDYARRLLYESGNDPWFILHSTRMMTSLWSVVIGLIVFVWSRSLFGTAGGFVSLLLYVFNPTALAHAAAATTDMCAALAFTASVASLWYVLNRLTPLSLLVSSLVWGLAFCSKFSLLLLIPIGLLMVFIRLLSGIPLEISGGRLFAWRRDFESRLVRLPIYLAVGLVHVVVTWCVIWVLFGFQFNMFLEFPNDPKQIYTGSFEELQEQSGRFSGFIGTAREMRLLPEAYLYCFAETVRTTSVRSSFLNGRYGIHGFASFFPYCMWYKSPISFFVLLALAAGAVAPLIRYRSVLLGNRPWRALWLGFYHTAPLWCLLLAYWYTSISRGINIGIRHILPTFPATFILVGAAGAWLARVPRKKPASSPVDSDAAAPAAETGALATAPDAATVTSTAEPVAAETATPGEVSAESAPPSSAINSPLDPISWPLQIALRGVVYACLAGLAIDVLTAFPNYLAYFNLLGGGSDNGYHHLVDSSLDWGQELPNLGKWLDKNVRNQASPPKVYISYFGASPPKHYGVDGLWLPGYFPIENLEPGRPPRTVFKLTEGIYCISATCLQCVYNTPFAGPWRVDYEQNYLRLENLIRIYMQNQQNPAVLKAELEKSGVPHWNVAIRLYDTIRFARLCAHLRHRPPDAMINSAILIFKLSASDVQQMMLTPPREMYPAPANPGDNVPF